MTTSKRQAVFILLGFVAIVIVIHLEVRHNQPTTNLPDPAPEPDQSPVGGGGSGGDNLTPVSHPLVNQSSQPFAAVLTYDPRVTATNPNAIQVQNPDSANKGGTIHY